ncbi:HAD family hydrolase [Virgibacillus sp. NKC19-3]|uniref:HAD family hydrolase n=1 Tax=Virgibacillus saliphilus TaxID=2831674 RepID=UPI001C9A97B1|nr:HAD family hydrolase [Virgibacillus sp. NKC19-3]MBY7144484.1 HAD family hydrolase [Virgibacillus sp. NKC19-3]
MNKVIICDLDGTLLGTKGKLNAKTIAIVREFVRKGGTFIIATGRLDHDIKYIEKKLDIQGAYRISQNGAVIRKHSNEFVWKKVIDPRIAKDIVKYLRDNNLRVEISDAYYRYFPSPRRGGNIEFIDHSIIDPEYIRKIGKDIHPTLLLTFGNKKIFDSVIGVVDTRFGEQVDAIMTSPSSLEFLSKGISKGAAIKRILQDFSFQPTKICAIGDSENDISMFDVSDVSYAVANADTNIKRKADEVFSTVEAGISAFMDENRESE